MHRDKSQARVSIFKDLFRRYFPLDIIDCLFRDNALLYPLEKIKNKFTTFYTFNFEVFKDSKPMLCE